MKIDTFVAQKDFVPNKCFSEIARVIPNSLQNKLIYERDNFDRIQWVVGDLFNEAFSYVRANDVEATRADVANFLLYSLGLEDERSYSSVLIDAATSAFYSTEARKAYAVLPFSHYRFAASFGNQATKVLETAMLFFNQYGRPPSIRWLKKEFQFNLFELAAKASEPGQALAPEAQAEKTGSFGPGPDYAEPQGSPVDKLRYHVSSLQNIITALPKEKGRRVAQIVALCNEVLEEL